MHVLVSGDSGRSRAYVLTVSPDDGKCSLSEIVSGTETAFDAPEGADQ